MDGVEYMCKDAPSGVDCAIGEWLFGVERKSFAGTMPELCVSSDSKKMLEGELENPGSLLWARIALLPDLP